jgi:hypothetical protein
VVLGITSPHREGHRQPHKSHEVKRLKNGDDSAERKALKIEILCERLTGDVVDKFVTPAMMRGIEEEPRAKEAYEQKTGRLVKDVGL